MPNEKPLSASVVARELKLREFLRLCAVLDKYCGKRVKLASLDSGESKQAEYIHPAKFDVLKIDRSEKKLTVLVDVGEKRINVEVWSAA